MLLFVSGIDTLLQTFFVFRLLVVMGGSYTFTMPTNSIILAGHYDSVADPHKENIMVQWMDQNIKRSIVRVHANYLRKLKTCLLFFMRKWAPTLEKLINANSAEVDWKRPFYLNLVAQTSYTVTVALCRCDFVALPLQALYALNNWL